jgi:hypothetical protein
MQPPELTYCFRPNQPHYSVSFPTNRTRRICTSMISSASAPVADRKRDVQAANGIEEAGGWAENG